MGLKNSQQCRTIGGHYPASVFHGLVEEFSQGIGFRLFYSFVIWLIKNTQMVTDLVT